MTYAPTNARPTHFRLASADRGAKKPKGKQVPNDKEEGRKRRADL